MARPRLGDSESKRLQMVITEDELDAIDDWQHANKVPSRSEAIRRLVQIGLAVEPEIAGLLRKAKKRVDTYPFDLKGFLDVLRSKSFTEEQAIIIAEVIQELRLEGATEDVVLMMDIADIASQVWPLVKDPKLAEAMERSKDAKENFKKRIVEQMKRAVEEGGME